MNTTPAPAPDVRARILAAVRSHPAPARQVGTRRRWAGVAYGFLALGLVAVRLGPHAGTRPASYVVLLTLAWLLVAVAVTWAGVSRGRSMLGRPAVFQIAVVSLTPVALLVLWWPLALAWPGTLENDSGLSDIVQCIGATALLALGPLLAFTYARRATDPVHPWLGGATLGVAAGGWGAAAMVSICRHSSASHMAYGHVFPVLHVAALGACVGARFLAVRIDRS